MSSPASEKQAKGKSKKVSVPRSSKPAKGGKEVAANENKFRGEGVNFKCKLLGVAEVDGPRGDSMCLEALKKLKQHLKQSGEHKPKIILNVTVMGIKILEERTKNVLFEHPVNKVSFITHDPEDKKIFSFISSAKCAAGSVGHMMYAIKYDKVAGIVTSTLYELFQTVYKLRQAAALKQRKTPLKPPTPDNISQASTAIVSNGPSQESSFNDNNIYEEPSTSSTSLPSSDGNPDTSHYKVPTPRPLPPAPYASASSQESPQAGLQELKENNVDSESVVNSSASDQFFGASVLSQPDHTAADNVSLSSVDIIRKDSISSSVSSSSETASFDTRSLDLKSVTATSTPPAAVRARPVPPSSSGQTREIKLTPPALEDENHDYETIPSSRDYETIPSDLIAKATANKTETKTGYAGFSFKETFAGDDQSFPVDFAKSNSAEKKSDVMVDPFRSPDQPEAKSSISEGSPPSSAVFGNDDFFSSHFDDKAESAHAPSTDFPVDDPFAPTSNAPPKEFQSGDAFASSDAFESAFGPGRMSPVPFELEQNHDEFEGDINSNKTGEKESEKSEAFASSSAFDAAFSSSEMPPPLFKATEEDSDKECTNEKPSTEEPKPELSWSNAFGESEPKENEKDTHKAELSWSTAFGESETHDDKEDNKPTKSDESKATFTWDDSFETKFDTEEVDKAQQPDKVATEPDFSWTNAFDDKPKKEVTFSWDDAFGGQTDTKDGLTENAFGEIKFSDAFASTPFKVPQTKNESTVEGADAFHTNHFESFLTPIKADIPVNDTEDKHSVSNEGKDSPEDITNKEEGGSEVSQSSEPGSVESERKAKLADDEDLSSSDKESDTNDSEMISEDVETLSKTIPQIIEPNNEDSSDNADDKPVRPVTLSILPTKPTNEQESPSVPPPLPPRPMAPLPSLPPRPRTYSSPVMGQIPPTPPQPAGCITSPTLKPGTPKRLPPALPPRIDLEAGKARASSVFAGSTLNSDPFSSPQTTISPDKENSWQAKWSGETPNEKEKDSSNSKHSPDPFGDDFFTDFNFSAAKTADHKTNSTAQDNHQLFSEPFASKEGEEDMFKAHFGGVDPFAEFSSNNTNIDPFASDGAVVFPGFSTSKDPFDDSMDPFAEKSTRSDPFAVSPKTNANDGTSFHLSKNSADGDFADSFA